MGGTVRLIGGAEFALPGLIPGLRAASLEIEASPAVTPPALLVTLAQTPGIGVQDPAIAAAEDFAKAEGGDRLVVNIWHMPAAAGWEATRHAAMMVAFTRYAARAWAGRHVRVNGLTLAATHPGGGAPNDDVTAAILALWRWPSMTGQIIHLGG